MAPRAALRYPTGSDLYAGSVMVLKTAKTKLYSSIIEAQAMVSTQEEYLEF